MSEVKRYDVLVQKGGENFSMASIPMVEESDFDTERALRLEAKQQVGELRRHLRILISLSVDLQDQLGNASEDFEDEQYAGNERDEDTAFISAARNALNSSHIADGTTNIEGKLAEAERQVGELRKQLADDAEFDRQMTKLEDANVALRAKLATAMGLLRRASRIAQGRGAAALKSDIDAFLNTTSTEGKDHE